MSTSRIQPGSPAVSPLSIEPTREPTAQPPKRSAFAATMKEVVLSGVEIGATLLGGPVLGAAVRGGRTALAAGPLGGEQSTIDQMRAMQEESQSFNLQYLALQEEVQQENRRFSTLSNVLKAKHETAKAAIGNIRS